MLSTTILLFLSLGGATECSPTWRPPEVHGIRLGMTVKQVKSRLPFIKIPPADKYDVRWSTVWPNGPKQRKRLPRISGIEMWFWKDQLVRYNISYFGSDKPQSINHFVYAVIEKFGLSENMRLSHRYECGNFSVSVGETLKRTVSLRDLRGEKILNRRVDESYGLKY